MPIFVKNLNDKIKEDEKFVDSKINPNNCIELWRKRYGDDNPICAIEGCTNRGAHGSHVFILSGDENGKHLTLRKKLSIIPACSYPHNQSSKAHKYIFLLKSEYENKYYDFDDLSEQKFNDVCSMDNNILHLQDLVYDKVNKQTIPINASYNNNNNNSITADDTASGCIAILALIGGCFAFIPQLLQLFTQDNR